MPRRQSPTQLVNRDVSGMSAPFENSPKQVSVGWVLRDMMQSTGIWCFDETVIGGLAEKAVSAGFSHLEIY